MPVPHSPEGPPGVRCTAHNRRGAPCKRYAIRGGTVCPTHGGSAPQVRAKANQRLRDMMAEAIDPDRWMREVAAIAYQDIRELFDDEGNLLPMKDWPEHVSAAVASVEVMKRNLVAGDGKQDIVLSPRPWSKEKALEMLGKFHGKLKERMEHSGDAALLAALDAGRQRARQE